MKIPDCTCGGRSLCLACVLTEFEGDSLSLSMLAPALEKTMAALARPVKP